MWVIVDKDVYEIISDQDLYNHPIVEVFGEEAVARYIESRFSMCEESDIGDAFADPDYQVEIIARIESEAQMKLFPEMEVNLPPYRIVVKIEEGK